MIGEQWFVSIEVFRETAMSAINQVEWTPSQVQILSMYNWHNIIVLIFET